MGHAPGSDIQNTFNRKEGSMTREPISPDEQEEPPRRPPDGRAT